MKARLATVFSLAGVIAIAGCVSVSDTEPSAPAAQDVSSSDSAESGSDETSSESSSGSNDRAALGQTLTISGVDVTVNSAESTTVDALSSSPDEDLFLILDVSLVNNSADEIALSSLISFSLRGSDAYEYRVAIFVDTKGSLDATVAPGDQIRGQIAFDVPNLDYYDFSVQPAIFGDQGVFRIQATDIQ